MVKKCFICDCSEWEDVDYLRAEPANMIVCKGCGFVTFRRFHDDSEYKSYYEEEYRSNKNVNIGNLVTTNRKMGYHMAFLTPWLKEKNSKDLTVGEIGAGIGYFLRWVRDAWNAKDVEGSELTGSFRRYAKHAFGINLKQEFDYSKRYDLVAIYHTLEHIPDPVEVLTKLRNSMKKEGALYIACPVWMEEMMRFGGGPFTTFDEHFHKDHINAWSRWHFKALLDKTGWKIIKEDPVMYGYTVLIQPTDTKPIPDDKPNYKDVVTQLSDMQRAATAFMKGEYQEAIRLYPKFVDAHLAQIGASVKDFDRQVQLSRLGASICPNTILFSLQLGLLYYQYQRFDEAIKEFDKVLKYKPHDDQVLSHYGLIKLRQGEALIRKDREKGEKLLREAVDIFDNVIKINPVLFKDSFDYIAYVYCLIPKSEEAGNGEIRFTAPHADTAPHVDLVSEQAS